MNNINRKIEQLIGEMNGLLVQLQDQYEEIKHTVKQEAYNPFLSNEDENSSLTDLAKEIEEKQAFLKSHLTYAES